MSPLGNAFGLGGPVRADAAQLNHPSAGKFPFIRNYLCELIPLCEHVEQIFARFHEQHNKEGLPKRLDRPSHSRIYASSPIRSNTGSGGAVGPYFSARSNPYTTENSDGRAGRNRRNSRSMPKK